MGTTRVFTAAVTLLAALGAAPGVASAAEVRGERFTPPIEMVLTVAKGEPTRPIQRRASLTCQPPGGTHRQARGACAELAKVGGRFDKLQLSGGMCTMQYDPVTVSATGRWKGRKVAYQHTFGNSCTLTTTTGPVFSL
jgi:hypothetical protein